MCVTGSWIRNKYSGHRLFVPCGHCPACQMSKALKRSKRIKNTVKDGHVFLFVTLTYRNEYVPYIRRSDFECAEKHVCIKDVNGYEIKDVLAKQVPVYRGRYFHQPFARYLKPRDYTSNGEEYQLDTTWLELGDFDITQVSCNLTREPDKDKIGICYYPDVQNFVKRLRVNLKRHYNYEKYFQFFSCSEYGSDSSRPHFHLLIQCPSDMVTVFKSAIVESWPFCDKRRFFYKGIEIARDAANYVSSYLGKSSNVSPFLYQKELRPRCSYSKGFGMAVPAFSFPQIKEQVLRGTLEYTITRSENGVFLCNTILIPKYVIDRLFPRIKGYFRFDKPTVLNIISRPQTVRFLPSSVLTDWTSEDKHKHIVAMTNKINEYIQSLGLDVDALSQDDYNCFATDYAHFYYNTRSLYAALQLKRSYDDVTCAADLAEHFDNIGDFYAGNVDCPSMEYVLDSDIPRETDPNKFLRNINDTNSLVDLFYSYDRYKKFSEKSGNHYYVH